MAGYALIRRESCWLERRFGYLDTYMYLAANELACVGLVRIFGCRQDVTLVWPGLVEERWSANSDAHDRNPDLPSAGPNSAIVSQIVA
jgi:hypothetical protein